MPSMLLNNIYMFDTNHIIDIDPFALFVNQSIIYVSFSLY